MDDRIRIIKTALLKILCNKPLDLKEIQGLELGELIDENILFYTIPFIHAMFKNDKNELIKFIDLVIPILREDSHKNDESLSNLDFSNNFQVPSYETAKMAAFQMIKETTQFDALKTCCDIKNGILRREDKIFMNSKIKNLNIDFIDWEDQEYLKQVLEVCLYRAMISFRTLNSEDMVRSNKESNDTGKEVISQVFNLLPCGHLNPVQNIRKELFKRRITPNKTLDEYVDSIMEDLKEREEKVPEVIKRDLKYLRKEDNEKDVRQNFKGNTQNMS